MITNCSVLKRIEGALEKGASVGRTSHNLVAMITSASNVSGRTQ